MGLSQHGYLVVVYSLSITVLVSFFVYAMVLGYLLRRRNDTVEAFLTARGQMSLWRVAWSFYAAAVGAWAITTPPAYATTTGLLGCIMYALSSGFPPIMISYLGTAIQRKVPHVLSLTDYVGWRFGCVGRCLAMGILLFNMSVFLLAEYTTVGALFGEFVGSPTYPVIIVVGVLTMVYTAYGGLHVSILTDKIQGIASAALLSLMVIYTAATFRHPLPKPMPCDPAHPLHFCISGRSPAGYSSVIAMPASLICATIFSEAMWQRVWAADSRRTLRLGALLAAGCIFSVVLFTGLMGLLAAWAGLITADTNPNLYLLASLKGAMNERGMVGNWIGVLVILLMVTMNESAIDSFQNGLTAAISSTFLSKRPLMYTRLTVVAINIPIMIVATKGFTILQLFLLGNMICCCASAPLVLGLVERLHPYYGGGSFLFAPLLAFTSVSLYGSLRYVKANPGASSSRAMRYAWFENGFEWQFFVVPLAMSIAGVALAVGFNWLALRLRLAHSRVFSLPGFVAPATHDVGADKLDAPQTAALDAHDLKGSPESVLDEQDLDECSFKAEAHPNEGLSSASRRAK
ncbi:hypothetical protein H632_c19p2 [Helicosporidium sp. ATCC 50920]|nr:hypothetical protein H632_c19p2 [Helicosporidium sp. ATCC 50920]|eukprot:KDD77100.1 hypothetical protein H632_c19p2 [Helicosporidium sp. ATCC 50920]